MAFIETPGSGSGWPGEKPHPGRCWFCRGPALTTCTITMHHRDPSAPSGQRDIEIPSCTACRDRFEAQKVAFSRRAGCGCAAGLVFALVTLALAVAGVALLLTGDTGLGAGLLAGAMVAAWLVFGPMLRMMSWAFRESSDYLVRAHQHPEVLDLGKAGWIATPTRWRSSSHGER